MIQNWSSTCSLGSLIAMCNYRRPFVWTWCLLWTICGLHRSLVIEHCFGSHLAGCSSQSRACGSHCCCSHERWSLPVRRQHPQAHHLDAPRRPGTLNHRLVHRRRRQPGPILQFKGAGNKPRKNSNLQAASQADAKIFWPNCFQFCTLGTKQHWESFYFGSQIILQKNSNTV